MEKFLKTLAIGATFSAVVGNAQAGGLPEDVCVVSGTRASLYHSDKSDNGGYVLTDRSGPLERSLNFKEKMRVFRQAYNEGNIAQLSKLNDSVSIAKGGTGEYSSSAYMPLVNEGGRMVSKYGTAFLVNVSEISSRGTPLKGTCELFSMSSGESYGEVPIATEQDLRKFKIDIPGVPRLEPYQP